jgi:hypothetical protein
MWTIKRSFPEPNRYHLFERLSSIQTLGDHPKAAIDDRVKTGHREKA